MGHLTLLGGCFIKWVSITSVTLDVHAQRLADLIWKSSNKAYAVQFQNDYLYNIMANRWLGECVLLLNPRSGGIGINIVEASIIIQIEPWRDQDAEREADAKPS